MMQDNHIFQGMRRDNHPVRQEKQFLWDAHNIRLTARDGSTMFSITNEKSTESKLEFNPSECYIGHVVAGQYLIVLTTLTVLDEDKKEVKQDRIYRISSKGDTFTKDILYKGPLNFNVEHPAQIIFDYESDLIQKIYWVDGTNPPRVLNIAKPELDGVTESLLYKGDYSGIYKDAPFNFVPELALEEEGSVIRLDSSVGIFPSGVIQYACTYVHKYGQESNIFYVSEPLYISYSDRGGSPEDRISTAFRITISNPDTKFQIMRVYSIIRTSIDATPTVKRVTDVSIGSFQKEVSVVDNNTTGDNIDPTYLLYVGGKDIIAGCIAAKDNVLFLGELTYQRRPIYKTLENYLSNIDATDSSNPRLVAKHLSGVNPSITPRVIKLADSSKWANQLQKNTSTFKLNETYRLGCKFQYKTGEWSEPIWIKDIQYDRPKKDKETYYDFGYKNGSLYLGKITASLPEEIITALITADYKRVQPLICKPSYSDRAVIAQGILCPTVGQVGNRVNNSGAYAQSSWLLRPWTSQYENGAYKGAVPACQHNQSLPFGIGRAVEIQTMAMTLENDDKSLETDFQQSYENMSKLDKETFYNAFVVDQSIVTLHSPEIEFGDVINILKSDVNLSLHKVGEVKFDANYGYIDLQTATPVADPDATGFINRTLTGDGTNSLISGLFYEDAMVDDQDKGQQINPYKDPRLWMVYLWHRAGSLNNDCVRPEGLGTRTSELKKKSILNYKDSNSTKYYNTNTASELEYYDIQSFNSNELDLVKLMKGDESINYYGNIDTLIPAYAQYNYVCTDVRGIQLKEDDTAFSGTAIVAGQQAFFENLKVSNATGTATSLYSEVITSGKMPYIVDTQTTITNSSSTGSESGDTSDSSTTITSSGTKTVTVDITSNATVNMNFGPNGFTGTVTLKGQAVADDGKSIIPKGYSWSISGTTTYTPTFVRHKDAAIGIFGATKHPTWRDITPRFDSVVQVLASNAGETGSIEDSDKVGDIYDALRMSKDGVRMKYKSAPHAVISLKKELTYGKDFTPGSLYLVEIRQTPVLRYGGDSAEALESNLWIPAGPSQKLDSNTVVEWIWGDTWFQKYEFLKTYPFTFEDINQVTEIGAFYCETHINIDGRYDRNRASNSFSLSPANFNLFNPVYSQLDTLFTSRKLDDDYYKIQYYPAQFLWSGVKSPAAESDSWTNLHLANSYDLEGNFGKLTAIQPYNDLLVAFQENAVSQILFNSRVQIQASDGVPIEIANSQRIEGIRTYSSVIGCQDKFSITETPRGLYFVDNNNPELYIFNGQIIPLGLQLGTLYWARDNQSKVTWRYSSSGTQYNGTRLYYDPKYQDVYFTPGVDDSNREALCFSEQLNQFTSLLSYGGAVMFPYKNGFYSIASNPDGLMTLWENFSSSSGYNNIFGLKRDYGFSFISNDNPTTTKIFDTIEMRADCYIPNNDRDDNFGLIEDLSDNPVVKHVGKPFNTIRVENEYQDTGEVILTDIGMRKKFRQWRTLIPRNKNSRERIRNPWAKITLKMKNPDTMMTVLNDLNVRYTI